MKTVEGNTLEVYKESNTPPACGVYIISMQTKSLSKDELQQYNALSEVRPKINKAASKDEGLVPMNQVNCTRQII